MNAIDLLKKQHKEVKALFKKMEKTENARQRRQLMDEIATALEGHTTIEEEIFYPAVRGLETEKAEEMVNEAYEEHRVVDLVLKELETKKAEEMVAEAFEEHHVVKLVLAELPQVDPEDERFEAKMTVLSELVEHHADEEEEEMFKLAKKIGEDELDELGERMGARLEETSSARKRRAA